MDIQIVENKIQRLNLYGFSAQVENNDFTATGFSLMNKVWPIVKANNLHSKGLNYWVYHEDRLFVGIELENADIYTTINTGLQLMTTGINFYAYYKHVGPYSEIKNQGQKVLEELKRRKIKISPFYMEIYGHNQDETKLETELIWAIRPSKEFMNSYEGQIPDEPKELMNVPEGCKVAEVVVTKE